MDKETGLYNFPQRYYDSRNVKWLTLDPIGPVLMTKRPGDVSSLNWYNYCSNNPVMYHDPEGLEDVDPPTCNPTEFSEEDYQRIANESFKPITPVSSGQITWTHKGHVDGDSPQPGVDISNKYGAPIQATNDGILKYIDDGDKGGSGWVAQITSKNELGQTVIEQYGHMIRPENYKELKANGDMIVSKGDIVGSQGNTGDVWTYDKTIEKYRPINDTERADKVGTHVHWYMKVNGANVDPIAQYNKKALNYNKKVQGYPKLKLNTISNVTGGSFKSK